MSTRCSAIRISTFAGPFHPRSFSSCPHWRAPAAIWFSNCCRRNSHSLAARHCESHARDTGQPASAKRPRTAASVWPWTQNHSSSCSICSANLDSFRIPFSHFTFHASRSTLHASRSTLHASRSTLHASRSTFHVSHFTFHVSRFTFHLPRSTFHLPRSTFHLPRSTIHDSRLTSLALCVPLSVSVQVRSWVSSSVTAAAYPFSSTSRSAS